MIYFRLVNVIVGVVSSKYKGGKAETHKRQTINPSQPAQSQLCTQCTHVHLVTIYNTSLYCVEWRIMGEFNKTTQCCHVELTVYKVPMCQPSSLVASINQFTVHTCIYRICYIYSLNHALLMWRINPMPVISTMKLSPQHILMD